MSEFGENEADLVETIARDLVEACSIDGLMIKQSKAKNDPAYTHIPITLFPAPYPLDLYKRAYEL